MRKPKEVLGMVLIPHPLGGSWANRHADTRPSVIIFIVTASANPGAGSLPGGFSGSRWTGRWDPAIAMICLLNLASSPAYKRAVFSSRRNSGSGRWKNYWLVVAGIGLTLMSGAFFLFK